MSQLAQFMRKRLKLDKQRCNFTGEMNDDIDRISSLPDELRVHILSFIKIKEAVQTCVLSKIWKNTWAHLQVLFFDLKQFFPDGRDRRTSGEIIRERDNKFERFVKAVLQNLEAPELNIFILHWSDEINCVSCNTEASRGCITRALEFKPRLLVVWLCMHKLRYCYEIFTCAYLREVSIRGKEARNIEIAPNSVHLPCLKILELAYVAVNDGLLRKVFLGCPIIEELYLLGCILNASRISSCVLKKLDMTYCEILRDLDIYTPGLSTLEISRVLPKMGRISHKKMPVLMNAVINFVSPIYPDRFDVNGPQLITSLSNVTHLNLALCGSKVEELLERGVTYWPIFHNLKTLKLGGWCLNNDFGLVAFFLQSPNLSMLTLSHHPNLKKWEIASTWEEPKVALYQRERLERVKIEKQDRSDKWIDQLVRNLHVHVKAIGNIELV